MTKPLMLYVHTPFCHHHCPYCDFFVVAGASSAMMGKYMHALTDEICQHKPEQKRDVTSIFLGGGTPSLLSPEYIESILAVIRENFSVNPRVEITLETNPEDVSQEKARAWKNIGINRISLGVQSFQTSELAVLERKHVPADIAKGLDLLTSVGIQNISVDLMFALPQQTLESLRNNLDLATTLPVKHLSAYNLTIEERTRFHSQVANKKISLPDDETQREMFQLVRRTLTASGFLPYEISNFAKASEFESIHNKGYWNGIEYLGFGVGAHSFQKTDTGYKRWWNNKNLSAYLQKSWDRTYEELTPLQHFQERIFTGLRQTKGIVLTDIENDIGIPCPSTFMEKFQELEAVGYLEHRSQALNLTNEGILISDHLFAQFF